MVGMDEYKWGWMQTSDQLRNASKSMGLNEKQGDIIIH